MFGKPVIWSVFAVGGLILLTWAGLAWSQNPHPIGKQSTTAIKVVSPENVKHGGIAKKDVTKAKIERPAKALLANRTAKTATGGADSINPKMAPGKVRWHKSHADACLAAKKSKKPVILFHMLGKLDDQFC